LADLFLDTFPYNAHTTAVDSLKAGVPVLTLLGEAFAGRVAASLLNALDLNELVTTSQKAYESLAIELATRPEKLMSIKERLKLNLLTKSLFNSRLFTRDIESIYLRMMERHWAGLAPDHIQARPSDINNVV
jgi:predicted O-linked N-acetylglucosamine transferase (SPINDLY family)